MAIRLPRSIWRKVKKQRPVLEDIRRGTGVASPLELMASKKVLF
jgi:hypothetical protein